VVILLLKRFASSVPASLVVVLAGIAAVAVFDLDHHGVDIVGNIEAGLPAFDVPDLRLHDFLDLAGPAVGVMLIGFAEGLGAAKTFAVKGGTGSTPTPSWLVWVSPTSAPVCAAAWS
jgi:sulfate permease, SulP family